MPASRIRCLASDLVRSSGCTRRDAGAGVGDADELEQLLHRAVLAVAAVQRDERDVGRSARAGARRGRARRRSPTTSWPRRSSASSTRAPERSDTWRSSERPPLSTATRLIARRRAPRARRRARSAATARARRRAPGPAPRGGRAGASAGAGGPVSVAVERDLLARRPCRCARTPSRMSSSPTPEKFSRIDEPPRPSRNARAAGHERDVLAQRAREQVGRVDVVGQRRPDEQPALRAASSVASAREVLGERVEHRVAPAPVELAQRRARRRCQRRSREVGGDEVLGQRRGAEVGGLLAEVQLLEHRPRRDAPSRGAGPARGSSRTCRGR